MLATQDVCTLDAIDMVDLVDLTDRERLIRQRHVIDLMELSFSQAAAEFAATTDYEDDGAITAIDWIRINCHMTGPAAADRVSVGRLALQLEQTVDALVEGEVGFAHLTVMARTADAVGSKFNETVVMELTRHLPALPACRGVFSRACSFAAEQAEQVEQRRLTVEHLV